MTIALAGALAPVVSSLAKQGLQQLLGGNPLAAKAAEKAATLAGKGFAQLLETGFNRLGDALENTGDGAGRNSFAVPAAALQLKRLDTDGDGSVSKSELQNGLKEVTAKLAQPGADKGENTRLQSFLTNAINHYEGLSNMDGKAGLSAGDLNVLSAYDNQSAFISGKDWNYLANV